MAHNLTPRPKSVSDHNQKKTLYDSNANLFIPQYFLYQKIQAIRWIRKNHENLQQVFENLNNFIYRCSPLDVGYQIEVSIHFQNAKLEFVTINFGTIFQSQSDQQIQKKFILKREIPATLQIRNSQYTDENLSSKNMVLFENVHGMLICKKNDSYQFKSEQLQIFKTSKGDLSCSIILQNGQYFWKKVFGQDFLNNYCSLNEQDLYLTIKFSTQQLWIRFLLMVNEIKTKNIHLTPFGQNTNNMLKTKIQASIKTHGQTDCDLANQSKNLSFFGQFYNVVYDEHSQTPQNDGQSFELNESFKKMDAILNQGNESIIFKEAQQKERIRKAEEKQAIQLENYIKELQFQREQLLIENINIKNDIRQYQQQKNLILSTNKEISKLQILKKRMQSDLQQKINARKNIFLLQNSQTTSTNTLRCKQTHRKHQNSLKNVLKNIPILQRQIHSKKTQQGSAINRVKRLISEITTSSRQSLSKYKHRNSKNA